jgi:catechol 2,3-dioxygenase
MQRRGIRACCKTGVSCPSGAPAPLWLRWDYITSSEPLRWYATVLGMTPNLQVATALGQEGAAPVAGAWVTNDRANHRLALVSLPGLTADPDWKAHTRLQHVAFEYATLDELLSSYARLKGLGIEPVLAVDHGATTAFYYEDSDRNSVELLVDNFGGWDASSEYLRTAPTMQANSLGTPVDPGKMLEARRAGASVEEVHRRAYAGEYAPAVPPDPVRVLS